MGGQKTERLIHISKEGEKACSEILDVAQRRKNARFYFRTVVRGLSKTTPQQARSIRRGQALSTFQNTKEKPFGLYDLKTNELLMRRDMTASRATFLNRTAEASGLFWKNIPY